MSALAESQEDPSLNIFKFVLTGGPCSGKTTGSARLQAYLSERGWRVFVVPEAATLLFLNGAEPADFGKYPGTLEAFQRYVLRTQIHLEDNFMTYAKATGQKCVVLCDRGLMDGSAYVEDEVFADLLKGESLDVVSARDSRYNAVLHLVTAADGAEQYYTLENNLARSEAKEEAKLLDSKTQGAWAGHPHHVIINNDGSITFEQKMERLVAAVAGFVGLQATPRKTHIFPLLELPTFNEIPDVRIFMVEKIMLMDEKDDDTGKHKKASDGSRVLYSFIRRRSSTSGRGEGADAYGLTTVSQLSSGEEVETKQVISKRVYEALKRNADPTRQIVEQKRYCFLWNRLSYSVIQYISPRKGLLVLRCQSDKNDNCAPALPPFVKVGAETQNDDESMSSRSISLMSH